MEAKHTTNGKPNYLTVPQMASLFPVDPQTIRKWIKNGTIAKYIRPGKLYMIPYSEYERLTEVHGE